MTKNVNRTTTYGLRHKLTGLLAQISSEENQSHSCGESRYTLHEGTKDEYFAEFEVDSPETAVFVLVLNTPWYNSTDQKPSWGSFKPADYEVVEIVRTVETTPVAIEGPVVFPRAIEQYQKPQNIAERYLGYKIEGEFMSGAFCMQVLAIPEGETLVTLKSKCRNRMVLIGADNHFPEFCLGAFELPEEYADLVKGKPGVGLFTHDRPKR